MPNGTQSPFEGNPETTKSTDSQGRANYTVLIRAMTPRLAKLADWLSGAAALAAGVAGIKFAFDLPDPNTAQVLALLALPLPGYFAARAGLYEIMQARVRVVFTPETFTIERPLMGKKKFDRHMPHKFALYHHRKADREEERLSYKEGKRQRHWWSWKLKRYFGKSYHLSFNYLDQRNQIITIYKHEKAHEILSRLNAVRQVMDNEMSKGMGQALSPEEEWADQAGGLEKNLKAGMI